MSFNRAQHLRGLEPYLHSRVLGQGDAITRISRALEASECDLNDHGPRPRGAFLFMGPSGVGKTSTAKAFSEYLFGPSRLSMLFMNELQRAEDVGELIDSIKRGVEKHPDGTVFLFDEIEKAHRAIIDVFISLVDEGEATGTGGERVSVGNCYLVMTSNIGAHRWLQMELTLYSRMESFAFECARKILRPELFNRLTETIVYRPLSHDTQIAILNQVLRHKIIFLEPKLGPLIIDEKSVNAHLLRKCFTPTGGARRLRQELDRQLNIAVLPWVLAGTRPPEGRIRYDAKHDQLALN